MPIYVPQKINVGFQSRSDTYTGKLAYVVYFDEKNNLRKERSWNDWRDENIPNEIYDNSPTEGFVLNKNVGGVENSYRYDVRKTYVRVYDPRGFEFEISIPNLLWILENCNSIKGKGLEGEFVYGWDGTELVLVPTLSPDYKLILQESSIINNSYTIKAKDLVIGATYINRKHEIFVYMGKYMDYSYNKTRFFFMKEGQCYKSEEKYYTLMTFSTIGKQFIYKINDLHPMYHSKLIDKLTHDETFSPIDKSKEKIISLPYENFVKALHKHKSINIIPKSYFKEIWVRNRSTGEYSYYKYLDDPSSRWGYITKELIFDNELDLYNDIQPVYHEHYLENGNLCRREGYYDEQGECK